jgi:hypothetical protein
MPVFLQLIQIIKKIGVFGVSQQTFGSSYFFRDLD